MSCVDSSTDLGNSWVHTVQGWLEELLKWWWGQGGNIEEFQKGQWWLQLRMYLVKFTREFLTLYFVPSYGNFANHFWKICKKSAKKFGQTHFSTKLTKNTWFGCILTVWIWIWNQIFKKKIRISGYKIGGLCLPPTVVKIADSPHLGPANLFIGLGKITFLW